MVMNEYISFCMLTNGLVISRFSEWNYCNMCGSVGSGIGLLIILFNRINVQCVEFLLISWLHCVGVGASVIRIPQSKWLCGYCWLLIQNCFKFGFVFSLYG